MPELTARQYSAFISYRHADNQEEGRRWAEWIHQSLETYEVPSDFAGKTNEAGQVIPPSLYPVFRDEAELPAGAELSEPIRKALANSATLIVLCSPRAVQSRFVADEIRLFKEMGKTDRIFALILDGEPNATAPDKANPAAECFPEPLRFGVARADGTIDWNAPAEPIAADVRPQNRPEQGYTSHAAYRVALEKSGRASGAELRRLEKEYAEQLQLAKLKLVAGLTGVPLGLLHKRDQAYQLAKARRRQRILITVAAAMLALAGFALWQRSEADKQRAEAVQQRTVAETNAKIATENGRIATENGERATTALANSDFREGINRLNSPRTSAEGMAFLARSARLGHPAALVRLWTLFQQRAFWVQLPSPSESPALPPAPAAITPDPKFAQVPYDGLKVAPSYFTLSPDGKLCVTIVNGQDLDSIDFEIRHFRVWKRDGTPVTPWITLSYEGPQYLQSLEKAIFSPDGRFLAVVGNAWREPQFVELWEIATARQIGDDIPATGLVPQYQNIGFNEIRFTSQTSAGEKQTFLLLASAKGDASAWKLIAEEEPDFFLAGQNRHTSAVTAIDLDEEAKWLLSGSEDGEAAAYDFTANSSVGAPIQTGGPVGLLQRLSGNRLIAVSQGGTATEYQLFPPIRFPVPGDLKLKHVDQSSAGESESGGPNAISLPKPQTVFDGAEGIQLMLETPEKLAATQGNRPLWSKTLGAPVLYVSSNAESFVVQTTSFITEVLESASGSLAGPPINERRLFTEDTTPVKPLRSSLDSSGKLVLTRSFMWNPPNVGIYYITLWDKSSGTPLSDRVTLHNDIVNESTDHAEFSGDGKWLLFGGMEDAEKAVKYGINLGPPEKLRQELANLAEALGGLKMAEDGSFLQTENRAVTVVAMQKKLTAD